MRKLILFIAAALLVPVISPAQSTKTASGITEAVVTHTGYTVTYDLTAHCPAFVEWTLTAEHLAIDAVSRTDEFIPDPDIPQTPETGCYSRSGYDRGHMAPAADFKWSEKAMLESFYTSNICPQVNELNAGLWLDLEKACRRWARYYGSVDIVCGPLFLNRSVKEIGSDGCRIRVPDAFFKVVLKRFRGRWYAMGWMMPNESLEGHFNDYAVSVDDIERVTGMDFFGYLDEADEREAEKQTDTTYWR